MSANLKDNSDKGMSLISSIKEVYHIFRRYKDINHLSGDNYNIFQVINMTSNEVKVHSAFIADLLDIKGKHGFGTAFLRLFLHQLQIDSFDIESAQVKPERYIGEVTETTGGQIDIDLWDKNGYHIIIENKIDAGDQPNQMIRYHSYGKDQKRFALYYLTPDGRTPDEEKSCTNKSTGKVLVKSNDYKCLAYSSDIINWLELCREKAVNKPLVREGISHYINLIKFLTNDTMSDDMKKEVKEELLKGNNIEFLHLLKESISTVEDELELQFWNTLKNKFDLSGYKTFRCNFAKGIVDFRNAPRGNKYYGFEIEIDSKINLFYGIRMDNSLYGGFLIRVDGSDMHNQDSQFSYYRDIIQQIDSSFQVNDYWLGWKWIHSSFSFTNVNENYCEKMANMSDFANSIFDETKQYIDNFKIKYENK